MVNNQTAIFAAYPNRFALEVALAELRTCRFKGSSISLLFTSERPRSEKGRSSSECAGVGLNSRGDARGDHSLLDWLPCLTLLTLPGAPRLVAAGRIRTVLGPQIVVSEAGLAGALSRLGLSAQGAELYEGAIEGGSILVMITADSDEQFATACEILRATGAQHLMGEKSDVLARRFQNQEEHVQHFDLVG